MAVSKSSLKRRGKVFYLRFSENATRKRISLHTNSRETAKELQRQFDSARARGEGNVFPTKTPLARAVTAYIAHMKVARTRHGYTADLSYLRNAFGPICEALKFKRRHNRAPEDDADKRCRGHAIASGLGLKTPTQLDYEMSAPDAPFLLNAKFVQNVSVPDSDVQAYVFDLSDGRCAGFLRSCLTPQWLDHRPIELQLNSKIFTVITKQGDLV
ncbi:MAG: hypothetical protein IT365_04610 [Candidatus Hydrogenedentes bacterium]|nr:hypothetical protein [Candidatus Hydrogenedentota bacterium]